MSRLLSKIIKDFPGNIKDKTIDNFFEQIIANSANHEDKNKKIIWDSKGQGWGQAVIEVKGEERFLDSDTVKSNTRKYINLQDGLYRFNLNSSITQSLQR